MGFVVTGLGFLVMVAHSLEAFGLLGDGPGCDSSVVGPGYPASTTFHYVLCVLECTLKRMCNGTLKRLGAF